MYSTIHFFFSVSTVFTPAFDGAILFAFVFPLIFTYLSKIHLLQSGRTFVEFLP